MASRQNPPPQLQVPVPKFPLSSPISEEISSPSCSSAEERELERTRPFDYLVKATRQRLDTTSGSGRDGLRLPNLSHRDHEIAESPKNPRLSLRGITKKKKNASKPVGLNLVTNFTLGPSPKHTRTSEENALAPFVDLNDLKQLSKAREKKREAKKSRTDERNNLMTASVASRGFQPSADMIGSSGNPFLDPIMDSSFADRHYHGLSPSDRHVMIGLAVPRHESSERNRELDSAGDQHTPLTPSIIVTPAREDAPWSTSSPETLRPRATSSVYSQSTPRLWSNEADIPPVPAIPAEHSTSRMSRFGSIFLSAHAIAAGREQKHRSVSADTIIEDDSPAQEHTHPQGTEDNDQVPLTEQTLTVNTETRPQSQGWWTYLLSPLLGKKSPLSPNFPRQSPSSSSQTKSQKAKEWWEKEVSCFSPETPETTMTEWWNDDKNIDLKSSDGIEQSRSLGVEDDTSTSKPKRQTTHSFMLGGHCIQGEAAEYYQACAHELFSKTPYFECYNHICSITPPRVIACQQTTEDTEAGETRDRGLILAEAGIGIPKSQAINDQTATSRGLLIDVDSPSPHVLKEAGHSEHGPSSAATSDSGGWCSSLSDDHEKSLPEPTKEVSREVVPEPQHAPALVPITVTEPTPAPTPGLQEPTAPPPPPPLDIPWEPTPAPAPAPGPELMHPPAPPQIINNYHYPPAPAVGQPQTITVERAIPHYVPVFPPYDGMQEQQPPPQCMPVSMPEEPIPGEPGVSSAPPSQLSSSEWTSQQAGAQQLNQGTARGPTQEPESQARRMPTQESTPISPAFQRAAGGPHSIPLSEVNAPAPAYSQYPREAPLPPRYDLHPAPGARVMNPTGRAGPGEAQRRRLEREDAAGKKLGGLWRGRGCFSNKGCFGRPGREGRLRRRWYFAVCTIFLIIVVLAIVLAITLTHKGDSTPVQSTWLNLTGYPPMPTGIATIAGTETQTAKSTCVSPSTLWSCDLPPAQESGNTPYAADNPSFRVEIRFRNGTYANSTDTVTSTTTRKLRRDSGLYASEPAAPSLADQAFIGNTTDGNSIPYAGEATPFYMTLLSPIHLTTSSLFRRSSTTTSANLSTIIPAPAEDSDGGAAAAVLYPLPESQPIRLYNRGQSDEHYGFYTYYDKSIFLASQASLNGSLTDSESIDQSGGVSRSAAKARCTWSQTRFLVQIWTQPGKMGYDLLSPSNGTSTLSSATPTSTSSTATSSSSATNYTRPGSFPYPVTITIDRHGGDPDKKLVYCYAIEENGHYNVSDSKLQAEYRGVGGTWINPANGNEVNGNSTYGGIDGGTGGCQCQWVNWISTS
ncbi:hypothetical protein N7523_000981 [Penicillium sp. IBT 18751x]|nr:hypothetical protein N7523_000981 [Penicillium sp. IBT 18751x]